MSETLPELLCNDAWWQRVAPALSADGRALVKETLTKAAATLGEEEREKFATALGALHALSEQQLAWLRDMPAVPTLPASEKILNLSNILICHPDTGAPIDLESCHLLPHVTFKGAVFVGKANFWKARFMGGADFYKATFAGKANFMGATFTGKANFCRSTFTEQVTFEHTMFAGGANFGEARFAGKAYFSRARFRGQADFMRATLMGDASFFQARFAGRVIFWQTTFTGETCFLQAMFAGEALFVETTFAGEAYFREARFFKRMASFSRAVFTGQANFEQARFADRVIFWQTTFKSDANFWKARFTGAANFEQTEFLGMTSFGGARFTAVATFHAARFGKTVSFRGSEWGAVPDFIGTAWKDGVAIADFEQLQTQLNKGELDWRDPSTSDPTPLTDRLQALRKMARDADDRPRELDYFALELQARYQGTEWGAWLKRRLVGLYGCFSDYGRGILLPFLWLLVLWLLCALGYLYLAVGGCALLTVPVALKEPLLLSLVNILPTLGAGSTARESSLKALYGCDVPTSVHLIAVGEGIVGLILLFLIALGLRNRFRL